MLELNVMGQYENPWKGKLALEVEHIDAGTWAPATDSFSAMYGRSSANVTETLSKFVGFIQSQKRDSIDRINLFSHGMQGLISFSGSIDRTTGRVTLDVDTGLDLTFGDMAAAPTGDATKSEDARKTSPEMANRFRKGACIVFYLCHSGSDRTLLQLIANRFQVVAKGFSQEIMYCPEISRSPVLRINRTFTSLEICQIRSKTRTSDFRTLRPNVICEPTLRKSE